MLDNGKIKCYISKALASDARKKTKEANNQSHNIQTVKLIFLSFC